MAYIEFKDVIKAYGEGDARIHALDGASFTVERGELAIILGASGAGKTTALNILGGMDTVTSGSVTVDGRDVSSANEAQLVEYRRADVGFVFQFYNLVPNLTALENVGTAFGRPAAARIHRPRTGKEPQAAPVRRAHGRARL